MTCFLLFLLYVRCTYLTEHTKFKGRWSPQHMLYLHVTVVLSALRQGYHWYPTNLLSPTLWTFNKHNTKQTYNLKYINSWKHMVQKDPLIGRSFNEKDNMTRTWINLRNAWRVLSPRSTINTSHTPAYHFMHIKNTLDNRYDQIKRFKIIYISSFLHERYP